MDTNDARNLARAFRTTAENPRVDPEQLLPEGALMLPDLPSGVYRHYKGPLYFVFGYGHDANADDLYTRHWAANGAAQYDLLRERAVVVYMALELTDAHTGPRLAVRTAEDFHALVCPYADCVSCGRQSVDFTERYCTTCGRQPAFRFTYVGPTWERFS